MKLLCWLGFHKWEYKNSFGLYSTRKGEFYIRRPYRNCKRCDKTQQKSPVNMNGFTEWY